jgi:hypothetical protein
VEITNARETTRGFKVRKEKTEDIMCAEGNVYREMSVGIWSAMLERERLKEWTGKEETYCDAGMSVDVLLHMPICMKSSRDGKHYQTNPIVLFLTLLTTF